MRKSCVLRIDRDVFVKRTGALLRSMALTYASNLCAEFLFCAVFPAPLSMRPVRPLHGAILQFFEAPFSRSVLIHLLADIDMQWRFWAVISLNSA